MNIKNKIQLDELNEKLFMLERFKLSPKSIIDDDKIYDIFYFITNDNQVLKTYYFSDNEIQKDHLKNYSTLLDYIENHETKFLEKFTFETKINFDIIIYTIPRIRENKKDFKTLFDIYYSFQNTVSYSNYFEKIQKNFKLISFIVALCFSVYSSYLYVALHDVGIPIQYVVDINIILSVTAFILISLISLFTIIPLLLLAIVHYSISITYVIGIFFFILFLIAIIDKFFWTRSYTFIKKANHAVADFLITLLPTLFILTLAYILCFPVIYIYDSIRLHQSNSQAARPTFLYGLYHTFTGYPKVSEIDHKKYLVTGTDSVNYVIYDLNTTTHYLQDANTSNFEQVCRNIDGNYNSDNTMIYEIISHSYKTTPDKATYLNVKEKHLILTPLTIESLDINKSMLQKNCQSFLSKKDSIKKTN